MRGKILALLVLMIVVVAGGAHWRDGLPEKDKIPAYLQDISVTIKAGSAEGSGVVKTRELAGKRINWVWTAAHVVSRLRNQEEVIASDGTKRQVVKFDDCQIVKELVENGRRVGELKMDATVVRYSKQEDLALLKIRKTDFVQASVVFYQDQEIPAIGTDLYHVGSLLGQMGSNSMTSGIVSQIGRTHEQKEYDQTTVTAFPGSSGGGVYLENGAYIGMVVRGAGEGFNLIVPVRRMLKWAESADVAWAIRESVPMPSEADLDKLPIEDTGATFTAEPESVSSLKDFPYLIPETDEQEKSDPAIRTRDGRQEEGGGQEIPLDR